MAHKHCVFCGLSDDTTEPCFSPNNPFQPDTVGNKPHGFPETNRERAKVAAENARKNFRPEDVTYISAPVEEGK